MTILVDIDGVIFNTQEHLLELINDINHTNFTIKDITSYNWFDEHFTDPWSLTHSVSFWNEIRTNQKAIKYILKWKHEGHIIKFVTASYYHYALSTKIHRLLDCFNGEFDDEDVIVCHDKNMVKGDILIDDNFDDANIFSKIPNQYSILYYQPWNINQFLQTEKIGKMLSYDNWDGIDAGVQFFNRLKK